MQKILLFIQKYVICVFVLVVIFVLRDLSQRGLRLSRAALIVVDLIYWNDGWLFFHVFEIWFGKNVGFDWHQKLRIIEFIYFNCNLHLFLGSCQRLEITRPRRIHMRIRYTCQTRLVAWWRIGPLRRIWKYYLAFFLGFWADFTFLLSFFLFLLFYQIYHFFLVYCLGWLWREKIWFLLKYVYLWHQFGIWCWIL